MSLISVVIYWVEVQHNTCQLTVDRPKPALTAKEFTLELEGAGFDSDPPLTRRAAGGPPKVRKKFQQRSPITGPTMTRNGDPSFQDFTGMCAPFSFYDFPPAHLTFSSDPFSANNTRQTITRNHTVTHSANAYQ